MLRIGGGFSTGLDVLLSLDVSKDGHGQKDENTNDTSSIPSIHTLVKTLRELAIFRNITDAVVVDTEGKKPAGENDGSRVKDIVLEVVTETKLRVTGGVGSLEDVVEDDKQEGDKANSGEDERRTLGVGTTRTVVLEIIRFRIASEELGVWVV